MAAAAPLRPGHVIRARGQSWIVQRHVPGTHGSVLDVRGRGADNRGERTSFLLPFEPIEPLPSSGTPRIVSPRRWRAAARSVLSRATPSYESLRSPARAALAVLPFQLEPALAIVTGRAARVLIADEVGLGKTIQAGLVISETLARRPDARVLVVMPAGLRTQWRAELQGRFALDPIVLDSSSIARLAPQWSGNPWAGPGVVLTSLDYVKRPEVVRALEALIWDVAVFDEAHALAGRSDRSTVAAALARRARTVVLLTATPHSGDEEAFARLTALGDLASRFPLLVFRRTRQDIGLVSSRRTVSLRVRPTRFESEMHAALMAYTRRVSASTAVPAAHLAMTTLTRRACSSAWSLARSLETRLRLLADSGPSGLLQATLPFGDPPGDDEPVAELGAPGLTDPYEERQCLERLLALARRAEGLESKLAAARRLLRRAREPAIVFTEYRDTLHRIAHDLRDRDPIQLHGGLTGGERHEVLRQFVGGKASLLLATDAASEGLNLHQRCRLVVNLELPWTPTRLEQRIGRVERLGQTRRVHAVHLLAAGTCEEDSAAVLRARTERVSGALGSMRATTPGRLTAGELPGLIVGDLRALAREEAARLEQTRALHNDPRVESGARIVQLQPDPPADMRPPITVLRRGARLWNDWVYRVVFEDPGLQPLWETAIGIRHELRLTARAAAERRRWLSSLDAIVEPALAAASTHLLSSLLAARHAPLSLALDRERAIASDLHHQRARLAASLLQPGLFDRRAERAAAAQHATLDEALDRCRRRLAELADRDGVTIDRRLAFGAIRR